MNRHLAGVKTRSLGRHLEGWEAGLIVVGAALMAAILAVPRAVEPDVLPVPEIDRMRQRQEANLDHERVARATAEPLPFEVRAVGELFRRYGRAAAEARADAAGGVLEELRASARAAQLRYGDEPLLGLRALQTDLCLQALSRWETTGERSAELQELSGALLDEATRRGWTRPPHRLAMTGAERRAMFRVRWVEVTGLGRDPQLGPSRDDLLAEYRFLLEHPPVGAGPQGQALAQLDVVGALERVDPEYPAALARGVLLLRLGDTLRAAAALRSHLDRHPRGAWTLRAENYLAAALARSQESDSP